MSQRDGLSDDAKALLLAAKHEGKIDCPVTLSEPRVIAAGGRNFITDSSPQTRERWFAALEELKCQKFVRGDSVVYFVTHKGFQVADELDPTSL